MITKLFKIMLYLILVPLFFYLFFRWFERANVWIPTRGFIADPTAVDIDYEEVFFETEDNIRLHGWYVPAKEPVASLLFCHGNGGNISYRIDSLKQFHSIHLNTFIFDYRGYGKSEGRLSEAGTYLDAQAAFQWLENHTPQLPLVIFGRSLGAAIAIDVATKTNASALICESAFTSVPAIGRELFPFLPVRLLCTIHYDALSKIKTVVIPVLIIHSPTDEIIPFHHSRELYEAVSRPKQFLEIQGGHNDGFLLSETEYLASITSFLNEHLPSPKKQESEKNPDETSLILK